MSSSTNSLNSNHSSTINPRNPRRYYGDITLDMINDFLNEDQEKDKTIVTQKIPEPTTNGFGLRDKNKQENDDDIIASNSFFNRREKKDNVSYAKTIKKEFERELKQSFANNNNNSSLLFSNKTTDDRSIIGSAMSQLESVTTMNVSTNQHLKSMHQAKLLYQRSDDVSICDSNNNYSKLAADLNEAANAKDINLDEKRQQDFLEVCKNWRKKTVFDDQPKLSITDQRDQILNKLSFNRFLIIRGSTGCGKTTQVPQFILDDHVEKKKYCNIIITQPRRIAATSIAKRVCSERSWELGSICGYQIGLDRQCCYDRTLITYVTTGVLLQKLIGPKAEENFEKYTHIIIDEVHERDLDSDFLLLVIKLRSFNILKSKIILMSATIDCNLFSKYFAIDSPDQTSSGREKKERVPVHDIESNMFDVEEFYWDDLTKRNTILAQEFTKSFQNKRNFNSSSSSSSYYRKNHMDGIQSASAYIDHIGRVKFEYENPEMSQEAMNVCICLLKHFDNEDKKSNSTKNDSEFETKSTISSLNTNDELLRKNNNRIIEGLPENRGSVLIFVPGMHNIQALNDLITKEFSNEYLIDVLPLHSEIPHDQQMRVFQKPKSCHRKVIISTSIAESSITVSDIKYVIDFCLTKELFSDPQSNYTHLRQEWTSKSSMNQRRGRAGRVSNGKCYRLITKDLYKTLADYSDPAILREPLSRVVLNVKRLNIKGEPKKILSLAIEPPKLSDIERTILLLKEIGALTLFRKKMDGTMESDASDGDLTYVGTIMANLPIDVRLSKLILLGHAFGKLNEAILIAAGLSTKTIFTNLYKSYLESYKSKWLWANGWMCDCLAILNVCKAFSKYDLMSNYKERLKWCKDNNIEFNRLNELFELKTEIEDRLNIFDIKTTRFINPYKSASAASSSNNENRPYDIDDEDQMVRHNLIIKMMIAGAFYPNYLNAINLDLDEAYKTVGYHDIKTTVQVKNLPNNEGVLYSENLKSLFRPISDAIVNNFEDTKAYIEFKSEYEEVKSNINFSVYLAVEMRLLRIPLQLKRLNRNIVVAKLEQLKKCSESICDISLDTTKSGSLRFSVSNSITNLNRSLSASRMSQNDSRLNINDLTLNNTTIEEEETASASEEILESNNLTTNEENDDDSDGATDFLLNKKAKHVDHSKFLSYVSLINTMNDKSHNIETSSRNSASRRNLAASNTNISLASVSSSRPSNFLASSHISDTPGSIVEYLRNPKYLLPTDVDQGKMIDIMITEIVECGHFWAQISDDAHIDTMSYIQNMMNNTSNRTQNTSTTDLSGSMTSLQSTISNFKLKILNLADIHLNALCVAPYSKDKSMYRAQIVSINKTEQKVIVLFVDYGNKEKKNFTELFEMNLELHEMPFQALECKLAGIKMAILKNPNSVWSKNANNYFQKKIDSHHAIKNSGLRIQVMHLAGSVAMVHLVSNVNNVDIGDELIASDFAEQLDTSDPNYFDNKKIQIYHKNDVKFVPTKQSDYVSKRPNIAGVALVQQFGQFNIRSNVGNLSKYINDSYDEYDHDNVPSTISNSTFNSSFNSHENMYEGEINLNGPYSPLEVTYYSLVNIGRSKKTRVSRDSINHVTLDDDPYNLTTRLMVSSSIFLNSNADTMVMRNTTLMPKLPGLTSLCSLLFTPLAEFRVNDKNTALTGAICGLGTSNNVPVFTDNDMEIVFDVNIDNQDIMMINIVRNAINMVIGSEKSAKEWTVEERNLRAHQQTTCQRLLDVIERKRKQIEKQYSKKPYRWNQINNDLLEPYHHNQKKLATSIDIVCDEYFSYHPTIKFKNN